MFFNYVSTAAFGKGIGEWKNFWRRRSTFRNCAQSFWDRLSPRNGLNVLQKLFKLQELTNLDDVFFKTFHGVILYWHNLGFFEDCNIRKLRIISYLGTFTETFSVFLVLNYQKLNIMCCNIDFAIRNKEPKVNFNWNSECAHNNCAGIGSSTVQTVYQNVLSKSMF